MNKKLITNVTYLHCLLTYVYRRISTELEVCNFCIRYKIDHTQVNLSQLKIFEIELDFAEYIGYSTLMCRMPIFAGPAIYHLPGNVISVTVALVNINVQPEYELSRSTRFGQFQKFGKIGVGALSFQPPPRKQFLHGV